MPEFMVEEQKFNQQLNAEIELINASLKRVQSLVSSQKVSHSRTQ